MINLNPKDWIMAGLALGLVAAGVWVMLLKSEVNGLEAAVNEKAAVIEMQKLQISAFVGAVDRQNTVIDALRVDMKQSVADVAEKAKTVETRYSTVKVKDDTCQAKLQAYEDLLRVFAGRDK